MLFHIALTYQCNVKCPFCYASEFKGEMKVEDFKKVLGWAKKQGIKRISLIGGEPSIHKNFKEIITILNNEKFRVSCLTNGTFDREILESFNGKVFTNFLINVSIPKLYYHKHKKNIEHNLREIKNVSLRYNIISHKESYQHIINLCKKNNIKNISYSLISPSMNKKNKYIAVEEIKKYIPLLQKFIKDCKKEKIKANLARPLPICFFSKEEQELLKKDGRLYHICEASNNILVVNPDLSVFPCVALNIKAPNLLDFNSIQEIKEFYKERINLLKFKNYLFPECKNCRYRVRKQCQGGCLAYKS